MMITTHDLFGLAVRLYNDGTVRAEERQMQGDLDGWTIAAFHVHSQQDVHPDHWEMHPEADEAVCVLTGGIHLFLRPQAPGDEEEMTAVAAGRLVVVPRGRWHRLELDGPSDLMSITLRRGSQLQQRADTNGPR